MKKIYTLIVVCLFVAETLLAQTTYEWAGPANGNWNVNGNWTVAGVPATDYPRLSTDNAIFDANATVNLNTDLDLNSILVSGPSTVVTITATGGVTRTVTVHSTASLAVEIEATCRLEHTAATGTNFIVAFADDAQGVVDGEWRFTTPTENEEVYFTFPATTGQSTALNVNNGGVISTTLYGFLFSNELTGNDYLLFNSGSSLHLSDLRPVIPRADYDAASTIIIDGVTINQPLFEDNDLGNVTYNCAAQNSDLISLELLNVTIKGDLTISNTNNRSLTLIGNGAPSNTTLDLTIQGDLNISGNSEVIVSQVDATNKTVDLVIDGDLNIGGMSFDLQTNNNNNIQPTRVAVKGNFVHSAGTFAVSSTATYQSQYLFIIEFNGSAAQTASSVAGSIDNAANEVTLRLNNPAGVTLNSPLAVGRMDFNAGNLNTTTTNILSINNISGAGNAISNPSASSFVDGPLRRMTNTAAAYVFPTGAGSDYRPATVIPSATTVSTFEVTYFNMGNGDASVVAPLDGVATDYYWEIDRIGAGSDAAVQLTVFQAVPGAQANDALVVAKYDGSDWVNAKGTTGTAVKPGTSSSGNVTSEVQTSFSPFTIGFGDAAILPTNLVSFIAKKSDSKTAKLTWKITDNSTPSIFEVMRSADGINFNSIGSVAGVENKRDYEFTDNYLAAGSNYYRLKMLDRDGAVTYSMIILVANGSDGISINSMMPTLVRDRSRLRITSSIKANVQFVVTDINGRMIHTQSIAINSGDQDVWLNLARLPSGIFHVTGYVNGGKTTTFRFIKL